MHIQSKIQCMTDEIQVWKNIVTDKFYFVMKNGNA